MRVCHFVQRYPPALGGSEAFFARLSRYLAREGDEVDVYTSTAVDLEAFWSRRGHSLARSDTIEDKVAVHRLPLLRFPGRRLILKPLSLLPWRQLQCLTLPANPICPAMIAQARRKKRFDIVHATAFPYAFPIACGLRLARRQGIPFVLTPFMHLGDPDDAADSTRRAYTVPPLRYLLQNADCIFVQTQSEQSCLVKLGLAPGKLVPLGMGVDPAECTGGNRQAARARWGADPSDMVVGHLANNSNEKGTTDLLLAAARLWARGQFCRIVLAGPEMPNFRRFWKQFHAPPGRVVRLGVLDDEQKKDFFAGLDVFALPSRSDSFGLVFLEAWANQLPNVGYRAGGVADVLRDQTDGLLVRPGDMDGLAGALARLLENPAQRQALGQAGWQRVGREFRWQDKLEKVRKVYLQLVGMPANRTHVDS
jgi:glycosyltransferase involved in cell wall biosynthesis